MYAIKFLLSCLLLGSVIARPARKDASKNNGGGDLNLLVLKFANVLEQLETQFYGEALQTFKAADFETAGFVSAQVPLDQFQQIVGDESTHTTVLESAIKALGSEPVSGCAFDFSSVLKDVATMAATARLVENVGVGAYLGAASLLSDPELLTVAASILTVEARHQTILNVLGGQIAIPQAFDIPLAPSEVLAIAGPFISGCDVGIAANPTLAITNGGAIKAGSILTFKAQIDGAIPTAKLFCQILAGGVPKAISQPLGNCVVPDGLNGPAIVFVTSDNNPLQNIRKGKIDSIVAGPAMFFMDNKQDALGQSVLPAGSNVTGGGTTTVNTTTAASETTIASVATTTAAVATTTASVDTSTSSSSASFAAATTIMLTPQAAATDTSTLTATSAATTASATNSVVDTTTSLLSPGEASSVIESLLSTSTVPPVPRRP